MSDLYIVVNVGCIECGVTSNIVGVFDKARAEELAEELRESHSWRQHGQNGFEVFPMPEVGIVAEEYTRPPSDIYGRNMGTAL